MARTALILGRFMSTLGDVDLSGVMAATNSAQAT
jgi:hypothetical protein